MSQTSNSSLLNDKVRTVELFVENLLWGTITADFGKLRTESLSGDALVDTINREIDAWKHLHVQPDKDQFRVFKDYEKLTEWLYDLFLEGRIDGTIRGEMKDRRYEARIQELEKEIERLKTDNQTLAKEFAGVVKSDATKNKNLQAVG